MNQTKTIEQQLIDDYTVNGCKPMNMDAMVTYTADELIEAEANVDKRHRGQFKKGNQAAKGNKAPRTLLSNRFIEDLLKQWEVHGNDALRAMLERKPEAFCLMVASLAPKHIELDSADGINWVINASPRLSVEEWQKSIESKG